MLFLFRFPTSRTHLLVVTSFDPLRVFLFDEGLVRLAAEPYPGGASRPGVPSNAPPMGMGSVMGSVTTHYIVRPPPHPQRKAPLRFVTLFGTQFCLFVYMGTSWTQECNPPFFRG